MAIERQVVTAVKEGVSLTAATIAAAVISTSVFSGTSMPENAEGATTPDVQLVLRVDPGEVALDGHVSIEFALLNDSDDPIYVYRKLALGGLGGVMLHIADAAGGDVESPFHFDALPGPPKKGDRYMFVRLEPAHFLGGRARVKVRNVVPAAGSFSLHVTYLAPISKSQFGSEQQELRSVWRETGVLTSNKVTLEVR